MLTALPFYDSVADIPSSFRLFGAYLPAIESLAIEHRDEPIVRFVGLVDLDPP